MVVVPWTLGLDSGSNCFGLRSVQYISGWSKRRTVREHKITSKAAFPDSLQADPSNTMSFVSTGLGCFFLPKWTFLKNRVAKISGSGSGLKTCWQTLWKDLRCMRFCFFEMDRGNFKRQATSKGKCLASLFCHIRHFHEIFKRSTNSLLYKRLGSLPFFVGCCPYLNDIRGIRASEP